MKVKICGLTNPITAKDAAIAGVDYIGLLFSKQSPRKVNLTDAREIAQNARIGGAEVVGVFVDESLEQIQEIIKTLDLKIVQLHWNQVKQFCHLLSSELQIIYVIGDNANTSLDSIPQCLSPDKDFLLFENITPFANTPFRYFIAGSLNENNVHDRIKQYHPYAVDLSSAVESTIAVKDINKIKHFLQAARPEYFGHFGGCYAPELLIAPLQQLAAAYTTIGQSEAFKKELQYILQHYAGRPTALYEAKNFAKAIKTAARIFLKREDLLHTGAHKLNNALGQCLLAHHMGKKRIIAETGAGQHGVATATACAMLGLECMIYMGDIDVKRQAPNVAKMRLLGAQVVSVTNGSATLKDAVNEALRDWAASYETTHYCLGSALGPYPFPQIVAELQSIIGKEAKQQLKDLVAKDPDYVIACVGGGSNSIGIFSAYLDCTAVKLIGVEALGKGLGLGNHAARFKEGRPGVLHGTYTYVLQTKNGQIVDTHSISAGLDYPAIGPEHAHLFTSGRAQYEAVDDNAALAAFQLLSKSEGIIPALESAHAVAYVIDIAAKLEPSDIVLVNLSGRGDKDLPSLLSGPLRHI